MQNCNKLRGARYETTILLGAFASTVLRFLVVSLGPFSQYETAVSKASIVFGGL